MSNKTVTTSSSTAEILSKGLEVNRSIDLYLLLAELVLGLLANVIVLSSITLAVRQMRSMSVASRKNNIYHSSRSADTPVVDIIVALLSVLSLSKLLTRTLPQLLCLLRGVCFLDVLCYVQGFTSTLLQHLYLWTMGLFIQDRYVRHYHQHDYISKCSHFVLYITLCCVTFHTSLHLCGPIYGFSNFGFLPDELSCSIDWTSRYSCPYNVYSVLLVLLPAYGPIAYWTLRMSYRMGQHRLRGCTRLQLPTTTITTTTTTTNNNDNNTSWPQLATINRFGSQAMIAQNTESAKEVDEPRSSLSEVIVADGKARATRNRSFRWKRSCSSNRPRSTIEENIKMTPLNLEQQTNGNGQQSSTTSGGRRLQSNLAANTAWNSYSSSLCSNFVANMSRSAVLTESKELVSVNLIGWVFLLIYTGNTFNYFGESCFEQFGLSPWSRPFHLTLLLDVTTNLLIPIVLLAFHCKLRCSLLTLLAFCLKQCRSCRRPRSQQLRSVTRLATPSTVVTSGSWETRPSANICVTNLESVPPTTTAAVMDTPEVNIEDTAL